MRRLMLVAVALSSVALLSLVSTPAGASTIGGGVAVATVTPLYSDGGSPPDWIGTAQITLIGTIVTTHEFVGTATMNLPIDYQIGGVSGACVPAVSPCSLNFDPGPISGTGVGTLSGTCGTTDSAIVDATPAAMVVTIGCSISVDGSAQAPVTLTIPMVGTIESIGNGVPYVGAYLAT
jgi:hypothetical protein